MKRMSIELEVNTDFKYKKLLMFLLEVIKWIYKFKNRLLIDFTVEYFDDVILYANIKEYTDPELDQI